MLKQSCIIFLLLAIVCCKEKLRSVELQNVRSDIRLGSKFYSIFLNEEGEAYVVKGAGSNYTDTLKIESSDTSDIFKLDSVRIFFAAVEKMKANPIFKANRTGTAPRAEVYYNRQKVYDSYGWDETFWELFKPIMEQIPNGYNPFRANNAPFE